MCDTDVSPVQSCQHMFCARLLAICLFCTNKKWVRMYSFDFNTSFWRHVWIPTKGLEFFPCDCCYLLHLYSGFHFLSSGICLVVVCHGFIVCKSLFVSRCLFSVESHVVPLRIRAYSLKECLQTRHWGGWNKEIDHFPGTAQRLEKCQERRSWRCKEDKPRGFFFFFFPPFFWWVHDEEDLGKPWVWFRGGGWDELQSGCNYGGKAWEPQRRVLVDAASHSCGGERRVGSDRGERLWCLQHRGGDFVYAPRRKFWAKPQRSEVRGSSSSSGDGKPSLMLQGEFRRKTANGSKVRVGGCSGSGDPQTPDLVAETPRISQLYFKNPSVPDKFCPKETNKDTLPWKSLDIDQLSE